MAHNLTYEISISFSKASIAAAEILRGVLSSLGVSEKDIVEESNVRKNVLSLFLLNKSAANKVVNRVRKIGLRSVDVKLRVLEKKDWLTKWKTEFKPFQLTERFKVIPSWLKKESDKCDLKKIYLDSDMAFGTGLHPTTRYMARLLEKCSGKFETFLDIGTGTALLAIIAERLGAKVVDAFDYDVDAVKTAKKNLLDNDARLVNLFVDDITKLSFKNKYDFVSANLITDDLILNKKSIFSLIKPGKYLAVSGISVNNIDYFRREFDKKLPLKCIRVLKGEGWSAFLFKRI